MTNRCVPGDPHTLGATWDETATNIAVTSSAGYHGGQVWVCRLDQDGSEQRYPLYCTPEGVWHGRVANLRPGDAYGFRASGPYAPERGLFFDADVLLTDPYAKALEPTGPRSRLSIVVDDTDDAYDWEGDAPPRTPLPDSVIYETHVRGFTMQRPDVPEALRGTFGGLASPGCLDYLRRLGVTAVELLPVHEFLPEQELLDRGQVNYWGYSTLGYFAPHSGYSSAGTRGEQVREFRDMVKAMHRAGLEVILDVVFNHTAEGRPDEPALCWRGLGNELYYRLDPADPSRYVDTTATGNTLDAGQPETLLMIIDSLRYWVTTMHVDGFRFDLAATLAREDGMVERLSGFFQLLYQEPVLNRVKLIAEPWDVGAPDSYQVGRFPPYWSEWNDRFRDDIRDFWRGAAGIDRLATRLAGSSDLYEGTRRGPDASVNFVTCHDGKTLADLVSYRGRHNDANIPGDPSQTAPDAFDRADNHGVEGPTDDPAIVAARQRDIRNFLLTTLVAQGVPMLLGGDERLRTQLGNTNAYCQDNAISWYDWTSDPDREALTAFTRRAVAVRRERQSFRRPGFLAGTGEPIPDVQWFGPDGAIPRWNEPQARFLGLLLDGTATGVVDAEGEAVEDRDVIVLVNAGFDAVDAMLPGRAGAVYEVAVTSDTPDGAGTAGRWAVGERLRVPGRSVVVVVATDAP